VAEKVGLKVAQTTSAFVEQLNDRQQTFCYHQWCFAAVIGAAAAAAAARQPLILLMATVTMTINLFLKLTMRAAILLEICQLSVSLLQPAWFFLQRSPCTDRRTSPFVARNQTLHISNGSFDCKMVVWVDLR
jgi:hypothetical protein